MADWIVNAQTDPRTFPTVQHRHPNGILPAVRDHTPERVQESTGRCLERWTFACPCGELYVRERTAT